MAKPPKKEPEPQDFPATSIELIAHHRPEEMEIIGRLVLTYGELEFQLAMAASAVVGAEDAFRILYRTRGEEARILIAEALILAKYKKLNLHHRLSAALSDLSYCRQIRNQYAHAHFMAPRDATDYVHFLDLQESAERNENMIMKPYPLPLSLLRMQDAYFSYVSLCLMLLSDGAGEPKSIRKIRWPAQMQRPPRHSVEVVQGPPPPAQPPEQPPKEG